VQQRGAQQPGELVALGGFERPLQLVVERPDVAVHRRIDQLGAGVGQPDEDAPPVRGVALTGHEPLLLEPVDAVGHGTGGQQQAAVELGRGERVGRAGTAERREHVALALVDAEVLERLAAHAHQVARQPCDTRRDRERRGVEVGALLGPLGEEVVDVVAGHRHPGSWAGRLPGGGEDPAARVSRPSSVST
jgi:hypothetical protein